MADREKVMKGLKCCRRKTCDLAYPEEVCPYDEGSDDESLYYYTCTKMLAKDALELLKEQQEQKHGHWIIENDPKSNWIRVTCSECKENVTGTMQLIGFYPNYEALWDYCPYCGAKMKTMVIPYE